MKTFRAKSGGFLERPYYELTEIDRICRAELMGMDLLPTAPQPIRIERFIEKRFLVSVQYDDLPPGILGVTRFTKSGVGDVVVSRSLSEDGSQSAERRLNTTLAHEAGHGLLHSHLFMTDEEPALLFGPDSGLELTRIMCRGEEITESRKPGYSGRWWEYQANQAMGALLLPKNLVYKCLERFVDRAGVLGLTSLPSGLRETAARLISETFEVNPIVARVRLEGIFPTASEEQLTL